jgi:raffinose/stachyose/melibiose transport system permease protein
MQGEKLFLHLKKGMMRMRRFMNTHAFLLFSIPAVFLYTLFFVFPMLQGLMYSFTDWNGVRRSYNFIGFQNYLKMVSDERIAHSLNFTIRYVILLVILVVLVSLGLALLLNTRIRSKPLRLKTFFRSMYFYPAILSLITVGLIFNQIFLNILPAVGKGLGIEFLSSSLLARQSTAPLGILLVSVWQGVALPTVLFLAGLQSIPDSPIESAMIDGAGPFRIFFNVKLPFLVPTLNMVVILTLKNGLTVFDYIMAMTGGGPAGATESLGLLIYRYAFTSEMKFSYGTSVSVVLFLIIAGISFFQLRMLRRLEVVA